MKKCLSEVFSSMATWAALKPNQVRSKLENVLGSLGHLDCCRLNPVGCDHHERREVRVRPHIRCEGNFSKRILQSLSAKNIFERKTIFKPSFPSQGHPGGPPKPQWSEREWSSSGVYPSHVALLEAWERFGGVADFQLHSETRLILVWKYNKLKTYLVICYNPFHKSINESLLQICLRLRGVAVRTGLLSLSRSLPKSMLCYLVLDGSSSNWHLQFITSFDPGTDMVISKVFAKGACACSRGEWDLIYARIDCMLLSSIMRYIWDNLDQNNLPAKQATSMAPII